MRRVAFLWMFAVLIILSCSHEIEGPGSPKVTENDLTYCGSDFQSFAIEGSDLSPMVVDGAEEEPGLKMPKVCLLRVADLDGKPVSGEKQICLDNKDVQWVSKSEIRFNIRASMGLTPGMYEVTVENPDGKKASGKVTLEVRSDGPIIFWADPSVVYNGISTQITIFGANLAVIDQVVLVSSTDPEAAEIPLDFVLVGTLENRIQAIVPQGTPVGTYNVIARKAGGCETTLKEGLVVTDKTGLVVTAIDPSFGWAEGPTPVTITGAEFGQVPRAYLNPNNPTATTVASTLDSVAFVSPERLTGVVPPKLPLGVYDLIVVNPDGRVGLLEDAFTVTTAAPPIVTNISPSYLDNGGVKTVTIDGQNFNGQTVTATCRAPDGTTTTLNGTVVAGGSATSFDVTFDTSALVAGTVCVVRVTNADGSYFDYSAIAISNPSLNLSAFVAGPSMATARRAPAVAAGRATNSARFVYAVGGDSGAANGAMASVEAVPIDIFGTPGEWFTQQVALPGPRTMAGIVRIGRFLYLAGGNDGATQTGSVVRAQVLDPLAAPKVVDVTVRKGATAAEGIGAGVWYYRVSAVMADTDPSNPGGETLPSDALVINLKSLEGTLVLTLIWEPVPGAKSYRIYRSPTPDQPVGSEQLFAEVTGGTTTTYEDKAPSGAPSGAAPIGKPPLPVGSTGVWMPLPSLATAREALGLTAAVDPADPNKWHLYAVGGKANNALNSVERLTITLGADGTQTAAAAWAAEGNLSAARSELTAYSVSHAEAVMVPVGTTYIYAGGGAGSNSIDAGTVAAGGALTFAEVSTGSPGQSGYAGVAGAEWLFAFGGQQGKPGDKVDSGKISAPPALDNWQPQGGSQLTVPRWFAGAAVESAFIFVVGGLSGTAPTASMERTVL